MLETFCLNKSSLSQVKKWVKELRKIVGNDIIITIAGNKSDLESQRKVDSAEAERLFKSKSFMHL